MRARPLLLLAAVFAAAALATWVVVISLPREGQTSPPAGGASAAAAAPSTGAASPALAPAPTAADGSVEVKVAAGPEPLAGAEVTLYLAPAEPGSPWRRAGEARSGPDGVARLFAPPGAYLVVARAPGLAPGRAEAIRTSGDPVTRAEVALEPAARLEGRAFVKGGGPVAGAKVRAIPLVSRWPAFGAPSAPPEETVALAAAGDGTFRLEGLTPGTWAIAVESPAHHPALLSRVAVPGEALAVALEPLGSLEGIVLLPDGRPAAGASVRAASADHGAASTAGPDGRYRLSAPAGTYVVQAASGDVAGSIAATLAPGEVARAAELRLGAAAALEGRVSLGAERALPGARVALFPHGTRERVAEAVAGPDGRIALSGLAPGAYDVRAASPGASPLLVAGVTLAAGDRFPLRLALAGTGTIAGTVRDRAGSPLAGARVRVVQRGDGTVAAAPLETRSDFEGRFRLDGVEVGRAEVVARQDGVLLGASRALRVAEGRTSAVDLLLPEPGVLAGRVAGGRPPPGTTVVAVAMGPGAGALQVARAAADAAGRYELVLPAGEYRVHAAPGDAARTDLRVTPGFARVEPRRTARLDLALASAVAEEGVEVLVLEPGGAPSPGAVVTLARPDDPRVALATAAGEDGRVALGTKMGMASQPVTIRARNGGRTGEETLTLPASGTVAVRLRSGGALQGVVRGRGRVAGFTLEIASQPGAEGWRTVEVLRFAGDRFELGDLPSEPLRLLVRADDGRRGAAEVRVAPGETRAVEIALGAP